MIDFKQIIAEEISKAISVPKEELASYIEIPKDINNGDYAFPCFRLAKTLKKAPTVIANEIKEMDINPLVATDRGLFAVDARIRIEK